MAIAIDQLTLGTSNPGGTPANIQLTTTGAVAVSGFIVLCIGWFSTDVDPTSISGGSLTWALDKRSGINGATMSIASAQAPAGLASSTVITVGLPVGAQVPTLGAMSFTGVKTSSPVDGTPVGPTGASTAAWATASYATAAGSVIVANAWNPNTASGSVPDANSIESFDSRNAGDGTSAIGEYRIVSSAGSYAVGGTWGAAVDWGNIAVAYLAAPSQVLMPHGFAAGAVG